MSHAPIKKDKLISVDFFKGIAIIMVIFVHSAQKFSLNGLLKLVPQFGQMGCQIFFVLSSFALCMSLSKRPQKFFPFMKHRLGRLAPGYITMTILYFILGNLCLILLGENLHRYNTNVLGVLVNVLFLNGLIPAFNNNVMRVGWYVGTSVILYAFTPIMYKIFAYSNKTWDKIKVWAFPLIVSGAGISTMIIFNLFFPRYYCSNNSFWYFSFVNQIAPYSLGFSLYELYRTEKLKNIKFSGIISMLFFGLSVFLFYSDIKYAFVFLPLTFGLAFAAIFIFVEKINC